MDHPNVPCPPRKSGAAGPSPMSCPNGRKASSVSGSAMRRVTVPGAIAWSFSSALVRVSGHPVPRDVHPTAHPDAVVLEHVIEEARETGRAAGAACQPHVEPDGHHLGCPRPLGIENVKCVAQIGVESLARIEPLHSSELHLVIVPPLRTPQLSLPLHAP